MTIEKIKFNLAYAFKEASRQKSNYAVGCLSIYIVVLLVTVLITCLQYSPLVFLTLAEVQGGQIDMTIKSGFWTGNSRLNFTELARILPNRYMSPRIVFDLHVYNPSLCRAYGNERRWNNTVFYKGDQLTASTGCTDNEYNEYCVPLLCQAYSWGHLAVIDTELERQIGIGRGYTLPPVPERGAYISENLARSLNVMEGDMIMLSIGRDFSSTIASTLEERDNIDIGLGTTFILLTVSSILDESYGKFPEYIKSEVFVEYDTFLQVFAESIHPDVGNNVRGKIMNYANAKMLRELATEVIFSCDKPRTNCYLDSGYTSMAKRVIKWATEVVTSAGFNQVYSSTLLLEEMSSNQYLSAFLNLILSTVLVLMTSLSIFLVYSLLMVSVETKIFETGILRMIGSTRKGLTLLILSQALIYAIPAWFFGILSAQIVILILRPIFYHYSLLQIDYFISIPSIIAGTGIGLIVPILSSILPIRRALNHNIHDALDKRHSRAKAVKITIERSKGDSISSTMFLFGLLIATFGFMIYYLLPLALISVDIALLFNIFLVIIIGLLVGLVLLALNLQPLVEKIALFVIFKILFFENKSLQDLITTNLLTHRDRNKKTSIMYALSLGFILFLAVSINIELESVNYQNLRDQAAQFKVYGWDYSKYNQMKDFESFVHRSPLVSQIAWASQPIRATKNAYIGESLMNVGRTFNVPCSISAVSPNFYQATDVKYLKVAESIFDIEKERIAESLYAIEGINTMIVNDDLHNSLALDLIDNNEFFTSITWSNTTGSFRNITRRKASTFLSESPEFRYFSSYPTSRSDNLISFPQFVAISKGAIQTVEQIPLKAMYIKLHENCTKQQFRSFKQSLMQRASDGLVVRAVDEVGNSLKTTSSMIQMIFQLIIAFAMTIAFFSLNMSMYTNIIEQSKEIGILRALGFSKAKIFRLYIYEAFVLVVASAILGIAIGTIIGSTISAQRSLLTRLPILFTFPYELILEILLISVVCAILATFGPILNLNSKSLVRLLVS